MSASVTREAIILAGGLGTRLRTALPHDTPKPLALVAGKPFLHWQLTQLAAAAIQRVILAVGWQAEKIRYAIGESYAGMTIDYCEERSPLGTGGAIRAALLVAESADVVVMNGDTYLDVDFQQMARAHEREHAGLTICCTPVQDAARFGRIKLEKDRIAGFEEKGVAGPGYINAGVYMMRRGLLDACPGNAFSFENDFLVPRIASLRPLSFIVTGDFVDIGIPADLQRAQTLFPRDRS